MPKSCGVEVKTHQLVFKKKRRPITTYIGVAQALVTADYLSEADIQAAADLLADTLIVQASEDAQDAASDDYSSQKDIIAKAENWEAEYAESSDFNALEDDKYLIEEAEEKELEDEDAMAAEGAIEAAHVDAALALLAAELIDEAK